MSQLEKLQTLGSYGLEAEKEYPVLSYPNPDGYSYHVRTGDARGLKSWRLVYDSLHDDPQITSYLYTVGEDAVVEQQQTPFEYYWRFFDRHHEPEVRPFVLTCPEDGRDYTVIFAEHKRSMRYVQFKMWSTGIRIVQFRGDAMQLGELGEVSQPNPQEI